MTPRFNLMPLKKDFMPDVIRLVVLIGLVAITSVFVPGSKVPGMFWGVIYLVWAVSALFIWHHPKAPESAYRWFVLAALSIVGALVWYVSSAFLAHLVFGNENPELSRVFDVLVTFMIAPGLTFIAVAGSINALVQAMRGKNGELRGGK